MLRSATLALLADSLRPQSSCHGSWSLSIRSRARCSSSATFCGSALTRTTALCLRALRARSCRLASACAMRSASAAYSAPTPSAAAIPRPRSNMLAQAAAPGSFRRSRSRGRMDKARAIGGAVDQAGLAGNERGQLVLPARSDPDGAQALPALLHDERKRRETRLDIDEPAGAAVELAAAAVERSHEPRLQGAQAIGPRRERIAQRLHEEWIDRARHLAAQTHGPVRGRAMHAREAMASERQPLGCGRNGGGELHDRVAHEEARQHHGAL